MMSRPLRAHHAEIPLVATGPDPSTGMIGESMSADWTDFTDFADAHYRDAYSPPAARGGGAGIQNEGGNG